MEKEGIIKLVQEGMVEKALLELLKFQKVHSENQFANDINMLLARCRKWKKEKYLDIQTTENLNIEFNKINLAILSILGSIEVRKRNPELEDLNRLKTKYSEVLEKEKNVSIAIKRNDAILGFKIVPPFIQFPRSKSTIYVYFDGELIGGLNNDESISIKTFKGIHYIDFKCTYWVYTTGNFNAKDMDFSTDLNFGREFKNDTYKFEVQLKNTISGLAKIKYKEI